MRLLGEEYKKILEKMPILCVDGIITNESGQYLLVRRINEPLKDQWWVPGGRVFKGETLEEAFKRKMKEELGIPVKILKPLGYYEKRIQRSPWIVKNSLHSVSIVFSATPLSLEIKLDEQSSEWGFFDELPEEMKNIKPFHSDL